MKYSPRKKYLRIHYNSIQDIQFLKDQGDITTQMFSNREEILDNWLKDKLNNIEQYEKG